MASEARLGKLSVTLALLVFFATLNLDGFGSLACLALALLVFAVVLRTGLTVSPALAMLVLFGCFHLVLYDGAIFDKFFLAPLAVLFFLAGACGQRLQSAPPPVILAGVLGSGLYAAANLVLNLSASTTPERGRLQIDVWTGLDTHATVHAALWIPAVGVVPFLWMARGRFGPWCKVLAVIIVVAVFIFASISATRTPLIILGLVVAACIVRFAGRREMMLLSLVVPTVIIIGWSVSGFLSSALGSLPLFARISSDDSVGLTEDARFERQSLFLRELGAYVGGGANFREKHGYVHNIILDEMDVASMLPAGFLAAFCLLTLLRAVRSGRRGYGGRPPEVLLFGLVLAMFALFMVEPSLESAPVVFLVFCLAAGAVSERGLLALPDPECVAGVR